MTTNRLREEMTRAINGVNGRAFAVIAWPEGTARHSGRIANQEWVSEARDCSGDRWGANAVITAKVRFDDNCRNGHETFSITGDIRNTKKRGDNGFIAGGCIHEEIEKYFPELAPLIKWHLTSSDEPLHYVANAVYNASNRCTYGKLKGEPTQFSTVVIVGTSPMPAKASSRLKDFLRTLSVDTDPARLEITELAHDRDPETFGSKFTFSGVPCAKWHECPFDSRTDAELWRGVIETHLSALARGESFISLEKRATAWSEGKARDLDAARSCAVWPDATDSILCADEETLTGALLARLPQLMADFKADIINAGFMWSAE